MRVTWHSEGLCRFRDATRRLRAPLHAVLPYRFSSSNDVTSKVQAVKLKRDLENRRSRVSPPSMLMSGGGLPPWRSYTYTPYRESCPLLPSLDARKEGPILGHFLINVRWSLARASFDAPPSCTRRVRSAVLFSYHLVPRSTFLRHRASRWSSVEKWISFNFFLEFKILGFTRWRILVSTSYPFLAL